MHELNCRFASQAIYSWQQIHTLSLSVVWDRKDRIPKIRELYVLRSSATLRQKCLALRDRKTSPGGYKYKNYVTMIKSTSRFRKYEWSRGC
jgi:hypothetical protein